MEFSQWFDGRDTKDPNGNPVRIGGWPAVFNPEHNPMTINGTVHLSDEKTWEKYQFDEHWNNHEEGHIDQGFSGWDLIPYAVGHIYGYVMEKVTLHGGPSQDDGTWTGHDYNPYEQYAEVYADGKDGHWGFGSPEH